MADPTLTRGATNFNTSGSTTLTLYNGQTENMTKSANLINLPLPASDSSGQVVFDLLGVTREFRVTGIFTTTDNVDGWKFVRDLASLIDGAQGDTGSSQVGYTYRSRIWNDGNSVQTDDIKVYVNDVTMDWKAGEATTVEYSITLFEVSTASG